MERNNLYPIFLKTHELNILIIGGGFVAEEKLNFLLKSSPDSRVKLVAPMVRPGTQRLIEKGNVTLVKDIYRESYIEGMHMVIATTDQPKINLEAYVTQKTLDGLFKMVAEEEAKIRRDPGARVTKLLQRVFN